MVGPEALSVAGEGSATSTGPETATTPAIAWHRWPQLIPIAQLLAVILGVLGIIWHQQQNTDNLRTELRTEIKSIETSLRAEIKSVETSLRAEIGELRVEVAGNSQRLARIEGALGIGLPDTAPK